MFLIDSAMAAPATGVAAQNGGGMSSIVFLVVLLAVGYLFLLRPQMKRQKDQRNLIASVAVGDEIVTLGGMLGKITKVEDQFFSVQVAENTVVRIQRQAVSTVLPKGTVKSIPSAVTA